MQRRTHNSQINHFKIRWDLEADVSLLDVGITESAPIGSAMEILVRNYADPLFAPD